MHLARRHRFALPLAVVLLASVLYAAAFANASSSFVASSTKTHRGVWYGLSADPYNAPTAAQLHARVVRIQFPISASTADLRPVLKTYAAQGIRVLPLAGFSFTVATPAQSRHLATWAKAFGPGGELGKLNIQHIEFGSETSFAYNGTQKRGGEYARRCKQASIAIHRANRRVGLLCQADNANQSDDWVGQMFKAVPNLGRYVAGWTVHPYGPKGYQRIADLIRDTTYFGASRRIPIDVTEWGLAISAQGKTLNDNHNWPLKLSYAEGARILSQQTVKLRRVAHHRLRYFILYRATDHGSHTDSSYIEDNFGLVTATGTPKGQYASKASQLFSSTRLK